MAFKNSLKEKLKGKVPQDKLELLPFGFKKLGRVLVVNLNLELLEYKKEIGKAILEIFSEIKIICNKTGEISGVFRKPRIEIIAGEKNTETVTRENGCKYRFDVSKLMFAKGNVNERVRIAREIKNNEIVLDMFAGIGYFSIPAGKFSKAGKIYSIELNPEAFSYLKQNILLNKLNNIEAINGDCRKEILKLKEKGVRVDRVIMGYLPPPFEFFQFVLKIVKDKSVIHFACLVSDDDVKSSVESNLKVLREIAGNKFKIKLLKAVYVKSYSPRESHYVLDLKIFRF